MQESRPSRTALRVAMRRAAHQLFDHPAVFDDPLALAILPPKAAQKVKAEGPGHHWSQGMRAFMAVRSRYAEDQLARAVARGTRQYVILGAGLDTFAYRNPHTETGLHVFEVDYPATQEWKRERLAAAGVSIPGSVTFAPIDFENQTLPGGLGQAGFDSGRPAFFSWLGVTMYLVRETVVGTFRFIASCAPGGGMAFDYGVPRESLRWMERRAHDALARRVESSGEPFVTFFKPDELRAELEAIGFQAIQDMGLEELNARYFQGRADGLRVRGRLGRLMSAEA
jgi:methyltransferase (TIGR00027 family)